MDKKMSKFYTKGEEVFNGVTHGVGVLLSTAGCAILIVMAVLYADAWAVVSCSIYGATLIILYLMSTLYHSFSDERIKYVFRILDHSTIYLLIAGTYTPFALITLHGTVGWIVFGVEWAVAILGIVLNATNMERFKKISMALYFIAGWTAIFAFGPIMNALPIEGIVLLLLGGAMYTGGIVFYALKRKYMHGIWHLFVLSGSVLHYFNILFYVLPARYLL